MHYQVVFSSSALPDKKHVVANYICRNRTWLGKHQQHITHAPNTIPNHLCYENTSGL